MHLCEEERCWIVTNACFGALNIQQKKELLTTSDQAYAGKDYGLEFLK